MATYTTSDFKPGLKFMQDGEPCVIVENEFVKPGKGQAFTRTRIRKLISGKVLDEADCIVTLWNGAPISVTPPNFVELEIIDTDPGLKGDTAGTGGKPATLSTGAVVKVPLFVQIGEVIKVDTRSGEYVSRVK